MPTWRVSIILALILSLAAACTPPPEPEGPRIETAEDLLAALRQAGVEVVDTALLEDPFPGAGRVVFIGPERVEIYQADSEAGQRAALQLLLQQAHGESTPNLWGRGRVTVMYDGLDGPTIALLSGLLGDSLNLSAPAQDEPYPPAVAAAIGWLAQETGAEPGAIDVELFEAAEWPDACLGLALAGEGCAAVLTPGWRVTMRIGDESYIVRSDELGTILRREP